MDQINNIVVLSTHQDHIAYKNTALLLSTLRSYRFMTGAIWMCSTGLCQQGNRGIMAFWNYSDFISLAGCFLSRNWSICPASALLPKSQQMFNISMLNPILFPIHFCSQNVTFHNFPQITHISHIRYSIFFSQRNADGLKRKLIICTAVCYVFGAGGACAALLRLSGGDRYLYAFRGCKQNFQLYIIPFQCTDRRERGRENVFLFSCCY